MRRTKEETSTRHIKDTDLRRQTLRCTIAHFFIRAWVGWSSSCVRWALRIFLLLAASDTKRLHNLSDGVSLDRHFLIMLQLCTFVFSWVAIHATAGLGLWRCSDSSNSIFRFKLVFFSIPNKHDLISRRASLFIVLFHPVHTYYSMFCRSHDWRIAVLDYFNIALFPVLPKQLANCRGHCSFVGLDNARNGWKMWDSIITARTLFDDKR